VAGPGISVVAACVRRDLRSRGVAEAGRLVVGRPAQILAERGQARDGVVAMGRDRAIAAGVAFY
jgi:hypothetical protein